MHMKRFIYTLLFIAAGIPVFAQSTRKIVFVIADGIPADVIERVHTPNLDAISTAGAYLRAHVGGDKGTYSETPTISAVGYNSLLTGTWVNKHNVWGNDILKPNYNYWTIFRLLKEQEPRKTVAVFSSWTDNRTKLVGDGLAATGGIHPDWYADGYELDTFAFPHDAGHAYMHNIDERVSQDAAVCIRQHAPDLSWVYLEYTDDMGHMHGDSPEFNSAVEAMDVQIGRLWQAIEYRKKKFGEDWLILITTDHGRDETSGRGHGGQTPRQRNTWIVTNARSLNAYSRYATPGIVDLMPTMARWLRLKIPLVMSREIDGVPLIGRVSLAKPMVNLIQGRLDLSWQPIDTGGKVKIWVAATNKFADGGQDDYQLLATVPVAQGHAGLDVHALSSSSSSSGFYKIWLQAPYNDANVWWSPAKTALSAQSAPALSAPAPALTLLPNGPAWGALYQQQAAEYDALCRQAYNIARTRLDSLLRRPWSKPPAIITDIDETLLDNSRYAVHQALRGQTYSDSSWIAWTALAACDTVPGALSFLQYAASRGVTVFYITNRKVVEGPATLVNLRRWGFPGVDTAHLILQQPGTGSSKESRRLAVSAAFQPLLYLGDNLTDFAAAFDHRPLAGRRAAVDSAAASFGGNFIVLPNPVYGDWEGALYDYHYGLPTGDKNKLLLDMLKTY
jgi:5'-nucleotidase (lipoprotein e(P4) family)